MAVIGYIALLFALIASLYSALINIFAGHRKSPATVKSSRNSIFITCGLISVSVVVLLVALLTHNFQIEYVASYTSRDTSWFYIVSALWAGNKGSLLFWAWLLSVFATIVALLKQRQNREMVSYAYAILMLTEAFFLIQLTSISNPFQTLPYIPDDGMGLNPLLENPGMIFHPPILLAGYVGFTIPFAFAIAALITKQFNDNWIATMRKWTLLPWLLLGIGNLIGAWWAYVELGWGGYWAWDPVENAGLMPWLMATAFLHSIMMQKRRSMLKVWNMILIILTFNLAIFGTFLTRSGFLSSVHTFSESRMVPFFLTFLFISLIGSLFLLYYRKDMLKDSGQIESVVSKEFTIQLNNVLLVISVFVVFIGTIFPAIYQAITGTKINIGNSFFNQVGVPIFLALIALAAICTLIGWQRVVVKKFILDLLIPFIAATHLAIILIIVGVRTWYAIITFSLCCFVLSSVVYQWLREIKARHRATSENCFKAFWSLISNNRPRYGGYLVHIAIILITIGVIGSSLFDIEKETALKMGESTTIKNYTITFDDFSHYETESKLVVSAKLSIHDGEKLIDTLTAEKYFHRSYEQPVTEVAIRTTILEDLYVILVGWDENGVTAFKILVLPLVIWIWIGGVVFLIGGLLAFWPARSKLPAPVKPGGKMERRPKVEKEIEDEIMKLRRSTDRFCPKCGAKCQKDARFCSTCGADLRQL